MPQPMLQNGCFWGDNARDQEPAGADQELPFTGRQVNGRMCRNLPFAYRRPAGQPRRACGRTGIQRVDWPTALGEDADEEKSMASKFWLRAEAE